MGAHVVLVRMLRRVHSLLRLRNDLKPVTHGSRATKPRSSLKNLAINQKAEGRSDMQRGGCENRLFELLGPI